MTQATAVRPPASSETPTLPIVMLLGFVLLQVVWIFSVPPFRASDEFDHAYRAAAVARGEWVAPPGVGTRGGGAFVAVPEDIVAAARPVCVDLTYTEKFDCQPASHLNGDLVTVGSGAGRYNPLFYAVIGTAARPFHGSGALYAMRIMATVLCCGMFALALAVTRSWARSRWPVVALAVACTPVVMFSSAVAAPNGLEILAGLTLCSAALGIIRWGAHVPRATVAAAVGSASVLVTLRSLGPLWCLLIMVSVLLAASGRRILIRDLLMRRDVRAGGVVIATALAASIWWIFSQRPLGSAGQKTALADVREGLTVGIHSELGWLLQSVAAFPFRNQLAPLIVYPCALLLFLGVVGWALRNGNTRARIAMELVALVSLTLPLALTALSFGPLGEVAWQGRYGLPFTLALLLIAGWVLDGSVLENGPGWRLLGPALLLNVLVQVPGVVKVLADERAKSPLAGTSAWLMPDPVTVAIFATIGALLMMWGSARVRIRPVDSATGAGRGTPEPARQPVAQGTSPHR